MLPSAQETFTYFGRLGLTLECDTRAGSATAKAAWSVRFGRRRIYRINNRASFATLEALWRGWYCDQPVLERNYRCARKIAESSLAWSADEKCRMEEWLYEHRKGRGALHYAQRMPDRTQWPWSVMQSENPVHRLQLTGAPWLDDSEPPRLNPSAVTLEALEDPAWRERALLVGLLDTQCAGLFAASLAGLIDDAERLSLDTQLAHAQGTDENGARKQARL